MSNDLVDFDPFAGPLLLHTAPTTSHQREIWTACQLGEDASLAYNESILLKLSGPYDRAALERSFDALVQRHEALRSNISSDGLTLCVSERAEGTLELLDLKHLDGAAKRDRLEQLHHDEVERPFDLSRPGLFRAYLIEFSDTECELLFTAHHIVCDGWSSSVLVTDWAALYSAEKKGSAHPPLPKLTLSAYANAEANRPPHELHADQGYWLAQYQGELPILDFPLDRPRPPQRSFRSRREDVVFEPELVQKLKQLSASLRVSLFGTLLGAFQGLLARLTGQSDIVVGVPFAGQSMTGHTDLVGHAVNMLPLRANIERSATFEALAKAARTKILDAQEHQNYTLGTLLSKLPIARDPSRAPLITATLNLDRGLDNATLGFEGLQATLHSNPRHYENFELFLNMVERDGTLEMECQYATSLFDAETIRRWLSAYRKLLISATENPQATLAELDWLPDGDLEKLAGFNAESVFEYEKTKTVHELVSETALATPNAVACENGGAELTYAELERRSSLLATKLVALGVGRGQFVGLCLERTHDLLIAALAIWKAGAAYVPLDPDYPAERLAYMVSDSTMTTLITSSRLERELKLAATNTVLVDALNLDAAQPIPESHQAKPSDVAYVIYTSGSTGKPKGVMVPHQAVVNLITSVSRRPGLQRSDVVLAITTLSFDIAVSEIWLPLCVGAKIVLTSREVASDGGLLRELVETRGITFIDATPATYRLLLGAGWQGSSHLKLICTGEAMPLDLARALLGCSGELWNGYGPTETTVWSTFWQAHSGLSKVLIGRAVDNTQLYVLDEAMKRVPLGVSGELYIGGDGVSHGYLNRPELTKERFLPDPFVPGGKLYRTGDIARFLPNGDLECLGRNDHQVKLRGFRIELGEIEDALIHHPSIKEATVLLREDRPGEARLVGYVVSNGDAPKSSELRAHLKSTLPDYMVPAVYVTLARMPLTPSGKIDRKALPAPETSSQPSESEYVAPATKTEELLAELWSKLLRMNRISVEDDFFALGGHSLLASQIIGRLRRDNGIELSFRKFFEAPTIRQLAASIDQQSGSGVPQRKVPTRRAVGTNFPLSLSQERLYLLEEMHPGQRVVHNLPAAWEFRGAVNAETLGRALDHLGARHETLRTTFESESGTPVPRLLNQMKLPLGVVDLRSEPEKERRAKMMELIHADSHEPFALEKGPLFRAILFRLEEELYVFYTLRHNIIWDGWSFDIFLGELAATYSAFESGRSPELPELPVGYGDYAQWQREELQSKQLAEHVAWWERELDGAPTDLFLPKDFPRKTQSKYAGGNVSFTLTSAQDKALTEAAHKAGTTLFMVMFAAYTVALHRYSGQNDILVGLPVRGRPFPDLENLIGPFTNTIVLRTELDPKDSFLEHLKKVRDRGLEAFSHEDMPLEMLGAKPPVVRALFSFQDARERPLKLGESPIHQIDVEHPAAANDLMVWTVERHDKLVAIANYNSEIFEKASVERFLRSFGTILEAVVADPTTPLERLPLLAETDAKEVKALFETAQGNRSSKGTTEGPFPISLANGDTKALSVEDLTISYASLREASEKVAQGLISRGLVPGEVVAIALDRFEDLLVAISGVWRAGLTAFSLDVRAPEDVSKALVQGAGARFLLGECSGVPDSLNKLSLSQLRDGAENSTIPSGSDDHAAWLVPTWEEHGSIRFEPISYRALKDAANALRNTLALETGSRVGIALGPLNATLPLAIATSLVGGYSLVAVDDSAEDTGTGALLRRETLDALLASPVGCATALVDQRQFPSKTIVLGDAPESLLAAIDVAQVIHVTFCAGPFAAFANLYEAVRGARRGRLLSSERVLSVVDQFEVAQPLGVVGTLRISSAGGGSPETLSEAGRLFPDGTVDAPLLERNVLSLGGYRAMRSAIPSLVSAQANIGASYATLGHGHADALALVVYYETRPESPTQADLRRALRNQLPEELVPQYLVEVDQLPVGPDGSVLEARLPSPFASSGVAFVEPRTKSEKLLARLFEKALGLARVGVHDNFFDLGGHSLLCLRVVAELEVETGRRLSPRVLLLNTLEQAAKTLDSGVSSGPAVAAQPLKDTKPEEPKNLAGRVLKGLSGFLKRS